MNFCIYTTFGQGQEMTLTFNTHISSYILPNFRSLAAIVSEISTVFRVIICTIYDGLESRMLHTQFRENRPTGSGEEDF